MGGGMGVWGGNGCMGRGEWVYGRCMGGGGVGQVGVRGSMGVQEEKDGCMGGEWGCQVGVRGKNGCTGRAWVYRRERMGVQGKGNEMGDLYQTYYSKMTVTSSSKAKWTGVESVRSLKNDGSHTVQSTHFNKPMATTGNLQKNHTLQPHSLTHSLPDPKHISSYYTLENLMVQQDNILSRVDDLLYILITRLSDNVLILETLISAGNSFCLLFHQI